MPTNRKERAAERRRQEAEANKTLIIPQITPEVMEQRRREANDAARRQTEAGRRPPAEPHPQQSPQGQAARTGRIIRQPRSSQAAQATQTGLDLRGAPQAGPAAPQPRPARETQAARPATPPAAPAGQQPAPPQQQPAPPQQQPRPAQPAPKAETARPGRRTQAEAEAELAESIRHDHIWLNNPVFVRGLGLASVVAAASTAENAVMLSAATLLLLTATRVLAEAVCHLTGNRFRLAVYCYAAALSYIPIYILLYNLFGADLAALGIYLPLLVVDPAVVKRMEFDDEETIPHALRLGLNNSVGVCIALLLVGCLRELLAAGSVFGHPVLSYSILPLAGQISGGFLVAGVLAAVWTAVSSMYVRFKEEEVRRLYAKRKR